MKKCNREGAKGTKTNAKKEPWYPCFASAFAPFAPSRLSLFR
jgi:hypothetical protein